MAYDFGKFKERTEETKEWLVGEYNGVRTGRATPALLDSISFDLYGAKSSIAHAASITVEDPKTLRVSPWDKTATQVIEKAITAGNLGVSVVVDDEGLRVVFPELTAERRDILKKLVKEKLEEARISVKKEREQVWNDISDKEKGGEMGEDDKFRAKDELQKLTDEANKSLEELAEKKNVELSE